MSGGSLLSKDWVVLSNKDWCRSSLERDRDELETAGILGMFGEEIYLGEAKGLCVGE